MSLSDKNILITPNNNQSADPKIEFRGASASLGPQTITLNVYSTSSGTLSFEGSAGQLFSITNDLTGTIFSVNDVSGIPSIEVNADGSISVARYGGNVGIGVFPSGNYKLEVNGSISGTTLRSSVATGTEPLTVASTTAVTNLNADLLDGNHASAFALSGHTHAYEPTITAGSSAQYWRGDKTWQTLNSSAVGLGSVQNLSVAQIFNNVGTTHTSRSDFNNVPDYGPYYVQGSTSGPGTGSSQFYHIALGLGSDYAFSQFALQIAIARYNFNATGGGPDRYLSIRSRESGAWQAWQKIWAGYADSAGSSVKLSSQGRYANADPGTTRGSTGLNLYSVYSNGYPTTFGNLLHLYGEGGGQLLVGWSGTDGAHAGNYIRSKRDNDSGAWSPWALILTDVNIGGTTVGSTTVVTNLNADLLDGVHASSFYTRTSAIFNWNADDTTGVINFNRSNPGDDYIIGYSSARGFFSRAGYGWHINSASSFHVMSSGWDSLFGVEGGTGNTRIKGTLTVPEIKLGVHRIYPFGSEFYIDINSSAGAGPFFSWQPSFNSWYFSGAVLINSYTVLHANNYSSYALPLSGGTLSGGLTLPSLSFGGSNPHVRLRHLDGKAPSSDTIDHLYLQYDIGSYNVYFGGGASTTHLVMNTGNIYPKSSNGAYIGGDGYGGILNGGSGYWHVNSGTFYVAGRIQARGGISNDGGDLIFYSGASSRFYLQGTAPELVLYHTTGTANARKTRVVGQSTYMYIDIVNDAIDTVYSAGVALNASVFYPQWNNNLYLGAGGNRWITVFSVNGMDASSDINMKKDIQTTQLGLNFVNRINPVSYRWKDGDGRVRHGVIAQQLREIVDEFGVEFGDLADDSKSLNYSGLIAPIIKAIQELSNQIREIKEKV